MSVEPDFSLHPDAVAAPAAADELFERMVARVRPLLPASAEIRHIGATAVSGCLTKGYLGIVVRVEATDFPAADAALAAHFARNTGSTHSDTFSSFESASMTLPLGLQLTVIGAQNDFFHTFAEALTRDTDLLVRYNALKCAFDGHPMDEYRAAKRAFHWASVAGDRMFLICSMKIAIFEHRLRVQEDEPCGTIANAPSRPSWRRKRQRS